MSYIVWQIAPDGSVTLKHGQEHEVEDPVAIPLDPSGYVLYHKVREMGSTPVSVWPLERGHELQRMHLSIASVEQRHSDNPHEIPVRRVFQRQEEPYFATGPMRSIEIQCRHFRRGTLRDDVYGNYPYRPQLLFDPEGGFAFTPENDKDGVYITNFLFSLRLARERLNERHDRQSPLEIWDEVRQIGLANHVDYNLLPYDQYAANYFRRTREFFLFQPMPRPDDARPVEDGAPTDNAAAEEEAVAAAGGKAARAMGMVKDMFNMDYNLSVLGDSERGEVTRWQYRLHLGEMQALLASATLSYEMTKEGYRKTWRFDDGSVFVAVMRRNEPAVYFDQDNPDYQLTCDGGF